MEEQHEDHGHSVAAWTAVGIILVGSAIASVGVVVANVPISIVGGVVIVLGAIAGKVMSMAGYGSSSHHAQAGGLVDAPDEVGSQTLGQS
jgi:hypothetical protein